MRSDPASGFAFDLSERTKLRVSGSDRQRYLNGQVTNDVRKASADVAVYAAVLSAKGKMNADIFVHVSDEAFLIDADARLREPLAARLERYVIADDVRIEDVTETFALFHVLEGKPPELADEAKMLRAIRFGAGGFDLWVESERREIFAQELRAVVGMLTAEAAEIFRIERGIPRWGFELTEEIIPVEANLEGAAIDYAKGCYIGQETISRMKMSGQTNKRLSGLVSVSGEALGAGMRLSSAAADGRDVGWITSATRSERLGFVKRGFGDIGARLWPVSSGNAPSGATEVAVAALPFV